jgi:glycosyltransferase involved in cell wall biosynthesis
MIREEALQVRLMKILHTVQFYHPSVGGAQEVVRQLSERLANAGHDVTVATSTSPGRTSLHLNGVRIVPFDIGGNLVEGLRGDVEEYRRFVLDSDFDVMMNYAAQQWATDLLLPVLDDVHARKVFVPCGFSALRIPRYKEYFDKMRDWIRRYDACVFASESYRDIDFARQVGVRNIRVIPNGAASEEFSDRQLPDIRERLGVSDDDFLILNVGSHTGRKGHWEALEMFRRSKTRDSVLLIIGNPIGNPIVSSCLRKCKIKSAFIGLSPKARADRKRVIMRAYPREGVVSAYLSADLFLFPSNIECSPIVLYEAMASRTPFLTTDVGNAKEIIEWGHGGLLIPTTFDNEGYSHANVNAGAALVEKLWKDQELLRKLAESGFRAWKERFTWDQIAKEYERLYLELM